MNDFSPKTAGTITTFRITSYGDKERGFYHMSSRVSMGLCLTKSFGRVCISNDNCITEAIKCTQWG